MLNTIFIKIIRCYQRFISPLFLPRCRFYPSCSEYSAQAFQRYSMIKALALSLIRLFKCHPYHEGGADPLK